jgi:glycosyltransferase involved in cell wall biosynthesis
MNNFLSIVWYRVLPPEYGGQKGIAHFNHCLGKKVPLTCLCSRNNVPEDILPYKILNNLPVSRFQFWNPFVRKQILSLIRQQSFTHIIIEHPWHGWLGKYKQKFGFRFIVHAHNIEHLRMKERGKLWWQLVKRTEQKAFDIADHILFKTERDKETAIKLFNISPQKCFIVPYGIKETEQPAPNIAIKEQLRKKYNIAPDEKLLLFAGTLNYEPNAKALEIILRQIIPLLQKKNFRFRLIICGALPEKRMLQLNAIPNVTAAGFVASIQDYLQSADVFINPVLDGSGIQTKNIEAIANGCTIVATAFAATGLPAYLINEKVFVSPDNDWEHFTNNIIIAASKTSNVPQQFYNDYAWQNIIDRLLHEITTEE